MAIASPSATVDAAKTLARVILPATGLALALLLWWLVHWLLQPPPYVLPPPASILRRTVNSWEVLLSNSWLTARVALIALLASSVVGIPLGIVVARWRVLRAIFLPPVVAIQSIPKIALAPLVIAWFGFGILPQVVVAFLVTFFPLMIAGIVGVDTIPRNTIYVARAMGCRGMALFRHILLPAVAPHVAAAFRVSATLALVGAIVAEFVGSSGGLGNTLIVAAGVRDMELVFAAVIATAILGILLYSLATLVAWLGTRRLNSSYIRSVG